MTDERFALHRVLFDYEDTHRMITSMIHAEFMAAAEETTHLAYNVFFGDETGLKQPAEPEKGPKATYNFSDVMREVNKEDPDCEGNPDYNEPASHFRYIDATLTWAITTPQLITNRVTYMLLWMFISEPLRLMIRNATRNSIGTIYFDGTDALPFKVHPFETRYKQYLFGTIGKEKTTVVASKLPPMCVVEEWILYKAIESCPQTANLHGSVHRRRDSAGGSVRGPAAGVGMVAGHPRRTHSTPF